MEELKTPVRIQILPPPSQSPEPELEKLELEPLPRGYAVLLVLTFVFSAVSLWLSFAA